MYLSKWLDNTCFQHDMHCHDFKVLPRIAASDKVLPDILPLML